MVRQTFAFTCGFVRLSPNFVLQNVIYIPNLLSVSQSLEQVYDDVSFTSDSYDIQEHTSRTLIGAGEQRDGLYYFKEVRPIQINFVIRSENKDPWHQRLGHPSDSAFKFFLNVAQTKSSLTCDICFRAKQTRV